MHSKFHIGDFKTHSYLVQEKDTATFADGMVHPVFGTFALAREAEWASRLFVLEMKEEHEEGIGTFIELEHLSPALVGQDVEFLATVESNKNHELVCTIEAKVGDRIIARGRTGQKILPKSKLEKLFESL